MADHRDPAPAPAEEQGPLRTARVYDDPSPRDGHRVLVDRLWPRGVSKERAGLDDWARDVAPSDELRRFLHDDRDRFDEFRRRYLAELEADPATALVDRLVERARTGTVTLLTASRDVEQSHVPVLAEVLTDRLGRG